MIKKNSIFKKIVFSLCIVIVLAIAGYIYVTNPYLRGINITKINASEEELNIKPDTLIKKVL